MGLADLPEVNIRYQRRKSLGLYVLDDASVEVRAPHGTRQTDILAFVRANDQWVRDGVAARQQFQQHRQQAWQAGARHYYLGELLTLAYQVASKPSVSRDQSVLKVAGPSLAADVVAGQIENWYRRQAKQLLTQRVKLWMKHPVFEGVPVPAVAVRKMKTRWGSCSSRGRVNFNLTLMLYPVDVIDMVVVHELCHLHEMNHSQRFYRLMDAVLPDWREREQQLLALDLVCFWS